MSICATDSRLREIGELRELRRRRAGQHAFPGERFLVRATRVRALAATAACRRSPSALPCRCRRAAAAPTTAATIRTSPRIRRRARRTSPARAAIAATRATAATRPRRPPCPARPPRRARRRAFRGAGSRAPCAGSRARARSAASIRAPASSNPVTDDEIDAGARHAFLERTLQSFELRGAAARQLAGDGDVAAAAALVVGGRLDALVPRRRRALELQHELHRQLVERRRGRSRAASGRTARARQAATAWCRGRVCTPCSSSSRAAASWPLANSSAAFSSTAHRPGLACATSMAFGAVDQSMMLAPRRLVSPSGSSPSGLPALRLAACAASSRADTTCASRFDPAARGLRRAALSWPAAYRRSPSGTRYAVGMRGTIIVFREGSGQGSARTRGDGTRVRNAQRPDDRPPLALDDARRSGARRGFPPRSPSSAARSITALT